MDIDIDALYTAAFAGDTDAIQEIANKNYLVPTDGMGQTALHRAVERGHIGEVEWLINAARNLPSSSASYDDPQFKPVSAFTGFLRMANNWKNTALHRAVENRNPAIVALLARADPGDRHTQNSIGETPLYIAARLGFNEEVKIICSLCTAPSIDGPNDLTALHAAIQRLPKAWKNVSLEANKFDKDAFRALIHAAKRSPRPRDASDHKTFEEILNKTTPDEETILDLAVTENYPDVVEVILAEHPAYQPGRNSSSYNHLTYLVDIASRKGYRDMVKLLCNTYGAGMASSEGQTEKKYNGLYAFLTAIRSRDQDFVIDLLKENEDVVTYIDQDGQKPLHHAVLHEFDSILEDLINARGGGYITEDDHLLAIWRAIEKGHTSTLIQLMKILPSEQMYVEVNDTNENMLHLAAFLGRKEIIKYLLKSCPTNHVDTMLNQKDHNGDTPLHVLIDVGCYVPELIKHKSCQRVITNNALWTQADMLYINEEIIADQVLIKEALDDIQQSNGRWKFWGRKKLDTSRDHSNRVPESRRYKKDLKFKTAKNSLIAGKRDQMKKELERYRLRTNTQIIVTALITTVTFTVGFTMPGGYHQSGEPDEGSVILSKKTAFRIFMVSDALALALSITSLFIYFISSMYEDPTQVSNFDGASTVLNIISVIAMMLTFIAGTYVVLFHSHGLAVTVCIICSIFFLAVAVLLLKMACDRYKGKKLKV